ncbi:MAG: metallophosphoesterase [Bacteroidota bacterium]|nr:metallophosphoesterase [Bacteroidota bacterium]
MQLFFVIFFILYSVVNYYIYNRGLAAISIVPSAKIIYTVLFIFFAFAYVFAKVFEKKLPAFVYESFSIAGSFWFAAILYFILSLLFIDSIRIINHYFHFYPQIVIKNYQLVKISAFSIVVLITFLLLTAGYFNGRNIKINTVNITLPKKNSSLSNLNIVQISDIHISSINNGRFLSSAVETINSLKPDIVLIPGDLVDEKAYFLEQKGLGKSLLKIKSKYGVYATTGNHEFINGAGDIIKYLSTCGVTWINDTARFIDGNFYIVGRHDSAMRSFTGEKRQPLAEVMKLVNKNYPVLLLDHTPFNLEEAEKNNIDLQLSGHTHHGQLFPINFITSKIYEQDWGYLLKGNTHYYVSSGLGTWGPPVKLGNDAEIVNIKVQFK